MPTDIDAHVGANVKAQRERLNLTREALAAELDTTATTVYRWETGRQAIPLEALVRIGRALGVGAVVFLDGIK